MRTIKTIGVFVLLGILFFTLNNSQGSIPPLGKFLNPFSGFWQNGTHLDDLVEVIDVKGLRQEVKVVWDERQVPHIFAENSYDAYFAQGYLTARHRLWQMEFQTHVAAGRVSEIIGPKAIDFDKLQRRRGLLMAAEAANNKMNEDPNSQLILQAYANGVNTWIEGLTPATLPLEYKLLNYEPEVWSTLKTALLLKFMAWDLTGRNSEMDLSVIRESLGEEFVERFYPVHTPRLDPIIPAGKPWRFDPLIPDAPSPVFEPQFIRDLRRDEPDRDNGSNNWAVAGKKTASGFPILANDPHLGLKLPSIWYEIQLHTPEMNVYGVSLPGAPAVIIGFNENIAWGLTNAGSDVMDWFEIEFRDRSYSEYWYAGDWIKADMRIEEILVRGEEARIDSFPVTRFGPLVHYGEAKLDNDHPVGLAMRWSAHDPSNEMGAIRSMNLASNKEEFFAALETFDAPGQNFAFASRDGDIAIRHHGKYPLRGEDEGKFVRAGRDTTGEWRQWIPRDQLPYISNPWSGYVSSANQNPTAKGYPYYLGWDYDDYERGSRINDRLREMRKIDFYDMQQLHTDNFNKQAQLMLPFMIKQLEGDTTSSDEEQQILMDLKKWNYVSDPDEKAAWVYKQWWLHLEQAIWEDELTLYGELRELPARSVTAELLLSNKRSEYYDDGRTPELEDRRGIIRNAFYQTSSDLLSELGPYGDKWAIGRARGTDINHLLSVKGLGRTGLFTGGGSGIVNATKKTHGPSWRMIVELGDSIKAQGIFPGGQSGNPGSLYYDYAVDSWVRGEYYNIHFLHSPEVSNNSKLFLTSLRNYQ
ncbi:MAG: penicillin acylase family protein [Candidatus Marinimicrobia bacterium]|nr:penicillin acylase family protein [Candidatus Neomarinimicrobiota bacterium]